MIRNSFIFLEKVGKNREQQWWRGGIKDWADFLRREKVEGVSFQKKQYYDQQLKAAQELLLKEDESFFGKKETWRLYDYFREETGFLDIEVDSYGKVMVVGISNYYQTNVFVRGANLEAQLLRKELSKYKLMVTFNGSSFDLPKLRRQCKLEVVIPHIDLKPLCLHLGLRGGLKEVERILALKRPAHLYGNPVELWKAFHASGDREYLEL